MFKSGFITKDDTFGKFIFWDIDGVLAPFRFNGSVLYPRETKEGLLDIENGLLLEREPSKFMQEVVRTCGAKEQIIMGHVLNNKEIKDKTLWVKRYFPDISCCIWKTTDISKARTILEYCSERCIPLCDVLFVDDTHDIIQEAFRLGIESWHISSFMDWFCQND